MLTTTLALMALDKRPACPKVALLRRQRPKTT